MSVRKIQNGRFAGLRVQRTVGHEILIKTWSFRVPTQSADKTTQWREATATERAEMQAEAEKYDLELAEKQKLAVRERVYNPFDVTERNNTGIRGLNYRMRKEARSEREQEVFALTIKREDGKMHNRYHRIDTLGYAEAWNKSINDIAEVRSLDPELVERMRSKMPKHASLRRLYEIVPPPKAKPKTKLKAMPQAPRVSKRLPQQPALRRR